MTDQTTDHLSQAGVQRYAQRGDVERYHGDLRPDYYGPWVSYDDHVSALAAAEDKGRSEERERLEPLLRGAWAERASYELFGVPWWDASDEQKERSRFRADLISLDAPTEVDIAWAKGVLASLDTDQEGS